MESLEIKKVMIEWIDSAGTPGWADPSTVANKPLQCLSIGWLVHDDDDCYTLALNCAFGTAARFGEYMTIPKCAVRSVQRLYAELEAP